jgi:hypothetical protein
MENLEKIDNKTMFKMIISNPKEYLRFNVYFGILFLFVISFISSIIFQSLLFLIMFFVIALFFMFFSKNFFDWKIWDKLEGNENFPEKYPEIEKISIAKTEKEKISLLMLHHKRCIEYTKDKKEIQYHKNEYEKK